MHRTGRQMIGFPLAHGSSGGWLSSPSDLWSVMEGSWACNDWKRTSACLRLFLCCSLVVCDLIWLRPPMRRLPSPRINTNSMFGATLSGLFPVPGSLPGGSTETIVFLSLVRRGTSVNGVRIDMETNQESLKVLKQSNLGPESDSIRKQGRLAAEDCYHAIQGGPEQIDGGHARR
jgi:hypothetical protein